MTELEKVVGRGTKLDISSLCQASQLSAFLEKGARKVAGGRRNTSQDRSCWDELQGIPLPAMTSGQKFQKPQHLPHEIKPLLAENSPP